MLDICESKFNSQCSLPFAASGIFTTHSLFNYNSKSMCQHWVNHRIHWFWGKCRAQVFLTSQLGFPIWILIQIVSFLLLHHWWLCMWVMHFISLAMSVELVRTLLTMCVQTGSKQTHCSVLTHEITYQFTSLSLFTPLLI